MNSDSAANEFLKKLLECGYLPFFNGVTRPSESGGSCIDNIFVKSNSENLKSYTYNNVFTDHFPIFLSLESKPIKIKSLETYSINYKILAQNSSMRDWSPLIGVQDTFFELLIDSIKGLIDESKCKINRKRNNKNNKPHSSWITKGIMSSCKTKENLYKLWNLDRHNIKLKYDYNSYCKILNKVIKLAKINHEKKYVNNIYIFKDSKKMWQYVNSKIGKKVKATPELDFLNCNDVIISDKQAIADEFVDFFSNVGVELANKIAKQPIDITKRVKHNPNSIFINPTNYIEVERIIHT